MVSISAGENGTAPGGGGGDGGYGGGVGGTGGGDGGGGGDGDGDGDGDGEGDGPPAGKKHHGVWLPGPGLGSQQQPDAVAHHTLTGPHQTARLAVGHWLHPP